VALAAPVPAQQVATMRASEPEGGSAPRAAVVAGAPRPAAVAGAPRPAVVAGMTWGSQQTGAAG
jgi:hypothetical protein